MSMTKRGPVYYADLRDLGAEAAHPLLDPPDLARVDAPVLERQRPRRVDADEGDAGHAQHRLEVDERLLSLSASEARVRDTMSVVVGRETAPAERETIVGLMPRFAAVPCGGGVSPCCSRCSTTACATCPTSMFRK